MRLERSRLLMTALVLLGLWSVLAYLRGRRIRQRAAGDDLQARTARSEFEGSDVPEDPFIELSSLEEAKTMDHTAVVMQGGGGAQIYLTVPVKYVECDQTALATLLRLLDAMEWNDAPGATLSFELAPIGSGIYAGMGGASIIDGVWLHPRFSDTGVFDTVTAVIAGLRPVEGIRGEFSEKLPGR